MRPAVCSALTHGSDTPPLLLPPPLPSQCLLSVTEPALFCSLSAPRSNLLRGARPPFHCVRTREQKEDLAPTRIEEGPLQGVRAGTV